MMGQVFKTSYASLYDSLYGDKNYEAECDLLEEIFHRYCPELRPTILDLGCGTGNHALSLARRGYQVVGVDRSPEMLAIARDKSSKLGNNAALQVPAFHQGDLRTLDLGQQFDAVLMMFNVLGYQLANDDVLTALTTVRRHLKPSGLFVADLWYGPAVLAQRPSDRVKVIHTPEGKIIRTANATLDTFHHMVEIQYHVWHFQGDRLLAETQEVHQVRYFFPQEIIFIMQTAGLTFLRISSFSDINEDVDESTWNVMLIGKSSSKATSDNYMGRIK